MMLDEDMAQTPRIGLPVVTYVVSLLASILLVRTYRPDLAVTLLICAVPAAALIWMVVQSWRAKRTCGRASCSSRTYTRDMLALMFLYFVLLFTANWLYKHYPPAGLLAVVVALLPALPLIGVVAALGRFITREKDEYQRMLHVRQFLIATGLTLVVSCVWGFLEEFGQVPHVPAYFVFVLWCVGLGFGAAYNEYRP
jgi:hypothetical protein